MNALLLVLFLAADADKLASEVLAVLTKQTEILKTVKDADSAKEALPKLGALAVEWAKLEKPLAKLSPKERASLDPARAEARKQLDRIEALPEALAVLREISFVKRHVVPKEFRARLDAALLSRVAKTYRLLNSKWPEDIADLAKKQPGGEDPLIAADKLKDPWGKPYQLAFKKDAASGAELAEVFTLTPGKVRISSLDVPKK